MVKQRILQALLIVLCCCQSVDQGCSVNRDITHRSDLMAPVTTGPISLLTKDSVTYTLMTYTLAGDTLRGAGTARKDGITTAFKGDILLSHIGYIRATDTDFMKGVLAAGFMGAFIALAGESGGGSNGLNVTAKYSYPVGGTSCPFVYAWDGNEFALQGEAFGVGFGKALELTTCSVLDRLSDLDGEVRIRLTNERAETQCINSVAVVAVETAVRNTVYADADRRLWAVAEELPPARAVDRSGKDITNLVTLCDNRYWESDVAAIARSSDFVDQIELAAYVPREATEGSIVIHAINTRLSETAYAYIGGILGDRSLEFLMAAENDSSMIGALKSWIDESSWRGFVWNGSDWKSLGVLRPEANSVPFAKVMRWKTGPRDSDTLRLRFTSLADVWKIDAIGIDCSPSMPLVQHSVPRASARGSALKGVGALLDRDDDAYAILLPGDDLELTFAPFTHGTGKKIVYAAHVRGHLYEWESNTAGCTTARELARSIPGSMRLAAVKELLGDRSVLLPLIYHDWAFGKDCQ